MMENNITISDISIGEIKTKEVVDQAVEESKMSSWWHQNLAVIIAENFKCTTYISRSHRVGITSIKFVGLKNDVEMARQVYLYAVETVSYNSRKYVSSNKTRISTKGMKNQYILGFLSGLKEKFAEQVKNNNWGLILVKDPAVQDVVDKLNLRQNNGSRHIRTNGSDEDRNRGYTDGKNFQHVSGKLN